MTKWTSVRQAREKGWNVRHEASGWQVAKLTLKGWEWRPAFFPTKERALRHAQTVHTSN